jgi:hypothetical protein
MLSGMGMMIVAAMRYYKEKDTGSIVLKVSKENSGTHQKPSISTIQTGPVPLNID